jgi:uncharacterized cofD-like protein
MSVSKNLNLVLIGGGTGSFTLLQSLKLVSANVTALVNMADSGGSTGQLRDELGVLPPGDIRQCLVALSEAPLELRDLFSYRFPADSSLAGHSFGNLFLSAVERMNDSFDDAVRMAGDVLRISGQVVPITLDNCQLTMQVDSQTIVGEWEVSKTVLPAHEHPNVSLSPRARLHPKASKALKQADLIIIAPGNLYASLAPALLVEGLGAAIEDTKAPVAFVCNLVNKQENTADFTVQEYVSELERFLGKGRIDYVLYNTDEPSDRLLSRYALEGEYPVTIAPETTELSYKLIPGKFLSHGKFFRDQNDSIERSLIRHDANSVCKALLQLIL